MAEDEFSGLVTQAYLRRFQRLQIYRLCGTISDIDSSLKLRALICHISGCGSQQSLSWLVLLIPRPTKVATLQR